jgi:hypothetical protein
MEALFESYTSYQQIDPGWQAYSSQKATLTQDLANSLALRNAESFLVTWMPHKDADKEFATIISGLPADIQTYLVLLANMENAAAASFLNAGIDP